MPKPTKLETEIAAGRYPTADQRPCVYADDDCAGPMKWVERTNDLKWDRCLAICQFHTKYEQQLHTEMNAEDAQGEDEQ